MADNKISIKRYTREAGEKKSDLNISPRFDSSLDAVNQYRKQAWEAYQTIEIPDGTEEDWRRTDLRDVDFTSFSLINRNEYKYTGFPAFLKAPVAGARNGGSILISPIDSRVTLDQGLRNKGVVFDTLENVIRSQPELIEKVLSRVETGSKRKFTMLTGAVDFRGIILYVPRNVNVELPLQSIFWAPGEGLLHSLHIFIMLEEGSNATYVHESTSPANEEVLSLHSGLIQVYVGSGAHLNFVELQSWGENVINFTSEDVQVDQDGSIDWIFGALGSKLTKNYSNLSMIGKGAAGKMSGFYFTDNNQHLDHDTQQNHLAPNTTSDLLFKGALLDNSRSVWQGMIYVDPIASKTDGYQANRNLVLSKHARADSIPGLEILTDDVRCTHGATVGQIDEEQVFYLLSRGLHREEAERLIVEGFFDPIMQRIPYEGVRQRFQDAIKEKMEHIR